MCKLFKDFIMSEKHKFQAVPHTKYLFWFLFGVWVTIYFLIEKSSSFCGPQKNKKFPLVSLLSLSPLADLIDLQEVGEESLSIMNDQSLIEFPWPQEVILQNTQGAQVGGLRGEHLKHALKTHMKINI